MANPYPFGLTEYPQAEQPLLRAVPTPEDPQGLRPDDPEYPWYLDKAPAKLPQAGAAVGVFGVSKTPADLPANGAIPIDWDAPGSPSAAHQMAFGEALCYMPADTSDPRHGHYFQYTGTGWIDIGLMDLGFIPAGPHGDYQYAGGSTEGLIGVQADDIFLSSLAATPLGNGVVRLNWAIPNNLSYSWITVSRSLYGRPVSILESRILYKAPRSNAYATFVDAALPHGREVCYSLFVLTTDAIPRWVRTASCSIIVANDPYMQNVFREQLPDIYWEKDLLLAEDARLPGNDHARSSDGALWRFFDLLGPELITSKALLDALGSMRNPKLCPTALLPELAKLVGGYEFTNLPEERLREVLTALVYNRKTKGTGQSYSEVLGAVLNCPVSLLETRNWLLDANSSQEFYTTRATQSPGYWWGGNSSTGVFQVIDTRETTGNPADDYLPQGNHVRLGEWSFVTSAGAMAAGKLRFAAGSLYFHEIDLHGGNVTMMLEALSGSLGEYFILPHLPGVTTLDAFVGNVTSISKATGVYQFAVSALPTAYAVDTVVELWTVRPADWAPAPLSGSAVLAVNVEPEVDAFVIRSTPPSVDTDPVTIREYGIPVEPGFMYLFSAYAVSKGESVQVETVIDFWNDQGQLTGDVLTDRTYLGVENYYKEPDGDQGKYDDIEADTDVPRYIDLLLDPQGPPPSGALPGTILKAVVSDTIPYTGAPASWVRSYVAVQAPEEADRLVVRLYASGPVSETTVFYDQLMLEKIPIEDLPRLPAGQIDWSKVVPLEFEPARSVNTLVHPYRRNMVPNPRAVGGTDFWETSADPDPAGSPPGLTSEQTHNATGDLVTAFLVDYPTPPFWASTLIGPDQTKYIFSMVGVKFSLFPVQPGKVAYRIHVEYLEGPDEDNLTLIDYTDHFDDFLGTIWTNYFHSFEILPAELRQGNRPYWIRISFGPFAPTEAGPPESYEFYLTDVLVDDLTDDLPYFDGETNSVDEEFGWLSDDFDMQTPTPGVPHKSPSGAFPRRLRREENIPVVVSNWLVAGQYWTITYEDGRKLHAGG